MLTIQIYIYLDGLAQNCSNSIANATDLLQPTTKPSICWRAGHPNPAVTWIVCQFLVGDKEVLELCGMGKDRFNAITGIL